MSQEHDILMADRIASRVVAAMGGDERLADALGEAQRQREAAEYGRDEYNAQRVEIGRLQDVEKTLYNERDNLVEDKRIMRSERDAAQSELETVRELRSIDMVAGAVQCDKIEGLQEHIDTLCEDYEAVCRAKDAGQETWSQIQTERDEAQEEVGRLNKNIDDLVADKVSLDKVLESMRSERNAVRSQLAMAQAALVTSQAEALNMGDAFNGMRRERNKAQGELGTVRDLRSTDYAGIVELRRSKEKSEGVATTLRKLRDIDKDTIKAQQANLAKSRDEAWQLRKSLEVAIDERDTARDHQETWSHHNENSTLRAEVGKLQQRLGLGHVSSGVADQIAEERDKARAELKGAGIDKKFLREEVEQLMAQLKVATLLADERHKLLEQSGNTVMKLHDEIAGKAGEIATAKSQVQHIRDLNAEVARRCDKAERNLAHLELKAHGVCQETEFALGRLFSSMPVAADMARSVNVTINRGDVARLRRLRTQVDELMGLVKS